jgi:peptidoglycan/xylan/chitin deacetylase (PgdA/CDA1 family)
VSRSGLSSAGTSAFKSITISVDDAHPSDLRTAELLDRFGLKATFYIPKTNPEREVMSTGQIRQIASRFDTGAHTVSHRSLKWMPDAEAYSEIVDGRRWLEDTTGNPVRAFCYPQGKFNSGTPRLVEKAGFTGARSCMFNLNAFPANPFLWGVSSHAYSHSIRIQLQHALLEGNFRGVGSFLSVHKLTTDWAEHFRHAVNHVEKQGGVAHLYFHSWEIDEQQQWQKLEQVLSFVSRRQNFLYLTNAQLFSLWHKERDIPVGLQHD